MFLLIRSQTFGCLQVPKIQPSVSQLKHGDFLRMTELGPVGILGFEALALLLREMVFGLTAYRLWSANKPSLATVLV